MTRAGLILVMAIGTMGIGYPALTPMPIKLMWNASASAPIGLYTIDFDRPFDVTDLVAVDAPNRSPPSWPSAAICPRACRS